MIKRKTLIYKTGVEYGDYTLNHVQGCSHGCKYPCYAYMMAKRFGKVKNYEEWIQPQIVENTMQLLSKRANAYNVRCSVLTKGILPAELATLPLQNEYGITVVSLDENFAHRYEPGAAPIQDRIAALRFLSENGCRTWVSIEPYPTPNVMNQNLCDILEAVAFTNKIIVAIIKKTNGIASANSVPLTVNNK